MRAFRSLHGRLLIALLAMLGTVWAGALTHARFNAAKATAIDVDERLKSSVSQLLLVAVLAGGPADIERGGAERRLPPSQAFDARPSPAPDRPPSFEIVWEDGRAPVRSADFPSDVGPTPAGFEERGSGSRSWRVLTVFDPGQRATGRVAMDDLSRDALARRRDRDAVRPLLWMLPLFAAVALVSVWLGLAPLRRLERAIEAQDPTEPGPLGLDADAMPLELRRLATVVERLLSRLRDVQRRQRTFTATAGHELRTPLAGCSVQLQVARRTADPAARHRALDLARQAIDAMDRLVGQLLTLARAEARTGAAARRRIDLADVVAKVIADRARSAADAGVALRSGSVASGAFVLGNATLLECMVGNLIDNAIKFSPRGATIDVALDARAGRVTMRVVDRGPGIPEAERDRVFDPFHRLDPTACPGSGLGLPTVRAVVSDLDGEVRLQAGGDGGTEAVVVLPAA